MGEPAGFDILAVKEVVTLNGITWDIDFLKRVKALERVYLKEIKRGSE